MARSRFRWGMAPLLIVSIVAVVTVLIAVLTYSDIRREQSASREGFKERAQLLTGGLNDIMANHIYLADIDSLRKLIEVVKSQPDITYVDVFSPDGRFLARSSQSEDQSDYATGSIGDDFGLNAAKDGQTGYRFHGGGLEVATPIMIGDDPVGVIQFGFSDASLSAEIREITLQHLWQGLVLIAVGIIFAYLIARYTTKPLRNLANAAGAIGQGELDAPVPVGGAKEVLMLGEALETMRSQLQELYSGLETIVEERTKELEEAYRELQTLDAMKDEFISTVSHELRTPLTSIKGAAEILLNYRDVDPATELEFLGIINNESDRLTRLINDVLDLARIESGEIEWHISTVHLASIIETAVNGTHAITVQKNVTVEIGPGEGLPAVRSDPDKLVQVVTNLLSNAIKFTPSGGLINVQSRLASQSGPGNGGMMAEISVADNGVGIPEIEFDNIFNRFQQAGSSLTDRPQGTGLGLAICKEIVQHLGGEIWVESELGKGSTFFFTVPVGETAN